MPRKKKLTESPNPALNCSPTFEPPFPARPESEPLLPSPNPPDTVGPRSYQPPPAQSAPTPVPPATAGKASLTKSTPISPLPKMKNPSSPDPSEVAAEVPRVKDYHFGSPGPAQKPEEIPAAATKDYQFPWERIKI